jgi:hypothetical protein
LIAAPEESVTVPEIVPRNSWAPAYVGRRIRIGSTMQTADGRNERRQPLKKVDTLAMNILFENLI